MDINDASSSSKYLVSPDATVFELSTRSILCQIELCPKIGVEAPVPALDEKADCDCIRKRGKKKRDKKKWNVYMYKDFSFSLSLF